MAIREIRIDGDPILRKRSKEVKVVSDRLRELAVDMVETMRAANGVGLAAPQVGVLRRLIIVDVGEGVYTMINPEIIEQSGEDIAAEGCLSIPNFNATVQRPKELKLRYMNIDSEIQEIEAKDFFARAICHEIDHLNGVLFKDIYIEEIIYEETELEDGEVIDD